MNSYTNMNFSLHLHIDKGSVWEVQLHGRSYFFATLAKVVYCLCFIPTLNEGS
jgi:hypothetical protein